MVKFYRMKYGRLPDEIRDNVFKVTDLDELRMMEDKPFKAHNINRYDILITKFYFFLMKIWKEGRPFLAESRESAGKLWREFFNMANADLKDTGYPKITSKNPMDVMLRMCFHSLCPLECYNRIYELDILHSLLDDPDGYEAENYPQTGRILNVLEGLEKSYQKISRIDAAKKADYEQVREFCCSVKSSVPVAKK